MEQATPHLSWHIVTISVDLPLLSVVNCLSLANPPEAGRDDG